MTPSALYLTLSLPLLVLACGGEAHHPDGPPGTIGMAGSLNHPPSRCEEGAVKECSINRKTVSGVTICTDGTKFCDEGKWSECYPESAASD